MGSIKHSVTSDMRCLRKTLTYLLTYTNSSINNSKCTGTAANTTSVSFHCHVSQPDDGWHG